MRSSLGRICREGSAGKDLQKDLQRGARGRFGAHMAPKTRCKRELVCASAPWLDQAVLEMRKAIIVENGKREKREINEDSEIRVGATSRVVRAPGE